MPLHAGTRVTKPRPNQAARRRFAGLNPSNRLRRPHAAAPAHARSVASVQDPRCDPRVCRLKSKRFPLSGEVCVLRRNSLNWSLDQQELGCSAFHAPFRRPTFLHPPLLQLTLGPCEWLAAFNGTCGLGATQITPRLVRQCPPGFENPIRSRGAENPFSLSH